MGSWSDDIFGNDVACDIRGEYRDRIKAGDVPEAAVKRVTKMFAEHLKDSDDKRTVWIALAAVQLENGGVTDDVREKALKGIAWSLDPDKGLESSPFVESALKELCKRLGAPVPVAKPAKPKFPPGEKGSVYAITQMPTSGRPEAVIVLGGSSGKDRPDDYGRVILLLDVKPSDVTAESIQTLLTEWRHYSRRYNDGHIGGPVGYYDTNGKLPARKTRLLLKDVEFPKEFETRIKGIGRVYKSAELPWVVYSDLDDWTKYDYVEYDVATKKVTPLKRK